MKDILLKAENLTKFYPVRKGLLGKKAYVQAVNKVSFEISKGEVLGIVGESGCGKSTLGRMLSRLESITDGKIIFDGEDITSISKKEMRPKRRDIQMVFQDPYSSLNPRMTIRDIIAEPLIVHKLYDSKEEVNNRVDELLKEVGMSPEHAQRYPHEFSGGQRQRFGIARALAVKPKLIIADEPVSALDVSIQAQVLNLLNKVKKEYDLTYVFIAHDLSVVEYFSDRIMVMYLGEVVELADKKSLYQKPMHPYTQALLSAIPGIDPRKRREKQVLEGGIPSALNPPSGCKFHTRCSQVMDVCKIQAPKVFHESSTHTVACHLYD